MSKKIRELKQLKERALVEARDIIDAAGNEINAENQAKIDLIMANVEKINSSIKMEEKIEEELQSIGIIGTESGNISGGRPRIEDDPTGGFSSAGELYVQAINLANAARRGSHLAMDERMQVLAAAPSNAASGLSGAKGGFLLPVAYSSKIIEAVEAPTSLFSLTDKLDIDSYTQKFPADNTTPWQKTGGIQAYWEDELKAMTQTAPVFDEIEFNARMLSCFVPVSNSLLDAPVAIGSYISSKAPAKMAFRVDESIITGTGVGQPTGILNSGDLISVAKESGQAADTIVRLNINKMWMRMPESSRRSAVWIVNQDIEVQLQELQFVGTESPIPLFMPSGGLSTKPFDTLKGRPVIYHEACKTLGDKGDIFLANLSKYATVRHGSGVKSDSSVHFFFDANATALRFIMYIGGRSWQSSVVSPLNGTVTRSDFVTLDERA